VGTATGRRGEGRSARGLPGTSQRPGDRPVSADQHGLV